MNKFFVDGREYWTDQTALIGADIMKIANCSEQNFLHVEDELQETGRRYIGGGEAVRLDGDVLHFFATPQCTM